MIVLIAAPLISDGQLWTLGCSSRSGKIQAKMRQLWNWFAGLVYFWLIFNRMQIKDLAFSDKCLIDRKWPLHYQLKDKRVLKTSLFSEGRLYQCISDGLSCCTSHFRSTALIVCIVPREVVKYEQKCTLNWIWRTCIFLIQIKGLAFSDKCLIDCKCPLNCQSQ